MKIVYFIDHLRPEGTQKFLRQLVSGLAAGGHQQTVLCLNNSWNDTVVQNLADSGAEVRIVGKLALASGVGLIYYWHWLRNQQFDVAVTLLFVADVVGRSLARFAEIPNIVSSLRARNVNYASWQRWLVRKTMPWADQVVLNSEHLRDFAIREEGVSPDRIRVIYNGIDVEKYVVSVDALKLRGELGIPANSVVLGGVGRLTYQKGFDILIQAFARLQDADCCLLIVGEGEEKENLQRLSHDLGIADRVILTDFRVDIPEMLQLIDYYVQPSRWEGMPNTVLEAMAASCPIVATGVDGTRELITDGEHGWLVPPENPIALSDTIQFALDNPIESNRRGKNARQRVNEYFSKNKMVDMWEFVLMDIDLTQSQAGYREN